MRDYTSDNPVFHKEISIVEEDDLVSADNDTAAAKQLIENDLVLNDRMEECLGKDPDHGDSQNLIVTFKSGDSESADAWTDVEAMQSEEEHRSLFRKLSIMVKNVRYLYKLLGTTDISEFGEGTVTGAIKDLEDSKPGVVSKIKNGLAPQLPNETTTNKYLRQDGTWTVPPDTNTTYSNMAAATANAAGKAGLVPAPAAGAQAKYLRGDGTWQTPPDTKTTITQSAAVTEVGKMAMDAVEKNAAVPGTMAYELAQLNSKIANDIDGEYVGYAAKASFDASDMVHVTHGTVVVNNRNGVITIKVISLQCDANVAILGLYGFVGNACYVYDTSVTGLYIDDSKLYSSKPTIDYAVLTFVLW